MTLTVYLLNKKTSLFNVGHIQELHIWHAGVSHRVASSQMTLTLTFDLLNEKWHKTSLFNVGHIQELHIWHAGVSHGAASFEWWHVGQGHTNHKNLNNFWTGTDKVFYQDCSNYVSQGTNAGLGLISLSNPNNHLNKGLPGERFRAIMALLL